MNVSNATITDYQTRSVERRRGGSGDSAKLLHSHSFKIGELLFSFLAVGHVKWVFSTDTVTFEYKEKGEYNNIVKSTLKTKDSRGDDITRGDRRFKTTLRAGTFGKDEL